MAKVLVRMRLDELKVNTSGDKTYYNANEYTQLFDEEGREVQRQRFNVGVNELDFPQVKKLQGHEVTFAVRVGVNRGGAFPTPSYYDARLVTDAE
jgi:hypothetical protein